MDIDRDTLRESAEAQTAISFLTPSASLPVSSEAARPIESENNSVLTLTQHQLPTDKQIVSTRIANYRSLDDLINSEKCPCCTGDRYHCPLCPNTFKPARKSKLDFHLERSHWKTRVECTETGTFSVPCHIDHTVGLQAHYHCPVCSVIIKSKRNFANHVAKCPNRINQTESKEIKPSSSDGIARTRGRNQAQADALSTSTNDNNVTNGVFGTALDRNGDITDDMDSTMDGHDASTEDMITSLDHHYIRYDDSLMGKTKMNCPKCDKVISVGYMKRHMLSHDDESLSKDINISRHHHTISVDPAEGIFCSSTTLSGPWNPVHIRKVTSGSTAGIFCENKLCIQAMETARRGGNVSFECSHARSTEYSIPGVPFDEDISSLDDMCENNLLTTSIGTLLHQQATSSASPLLVYLPNPQYASQRYLYFSVYTGKQHYWCPNKRCIVTLDTHSHSLKCKCSVKSTCMHKQAVRWCLFKDMNTMLTAVDAKFQSNTLEVKPSRLVPELNNDHEEIPNTQVDYYQASIYQPAST